MSRSRTPAFAFAFVAGCSASSQKGLPVGGICSSGDQCASTMCFVLGGGTNGIGGLCGSQCSTDSDCGAGAACLGGAAGGAPGCVQTCATASDCSAGVPCTHNATVPAPGGICWPIAPDVCVRASTQAACIACLGASCCAPLEACLGERACGAIVDASCTGTSCTSALASGDGPSTTLASCAKSSCSTACGQ